MALNGLVCAAVPLRYYSLSQLIYEWQIVISRSLSFVLVGRRC